MGIQTNSRLAEPCSSFLKDIDTSAQEIPPHVVFHGRFLPSSEFGRPSQVQVLRGPPNSRIVIVGLNDGLLYNMAERESQYVHAMVLLEAATCASGISRYMYMYSSD